MGAVHQRDAVEAKVAVDHLTQLDSVATRSGEDLFARNIRMLRLELLGWLAQMDGDSVAALAQLGEAADLERATPKHAVTPAPTLPAEELLGDLLLEQGKPGEALEAYRRSLTLYPRRFNSLLGAARAARRSGDEASALDLLRQLQEVGGEGTRAMKVD
jgi:tetratricopeptide (TPR) repeat protein